MERRLSLGLLLLICFSCLALVQCRPHGRSEVNSEVPTVVATTAMIGSLLQEIAGERVRVEVLMGPGVDPHLYKPTMGDSRKLQAAQGVFYSGLALEGRMIEIFTQLKSAGKTVHAVTDGVPGDLLLRDEEDAEAKDPHVWFDVSLWAHTVEIMVQGLGEVDPEGKEVFLGRGKALKAKLDELHAWCVELTQALPESKRILVTSHDAYSYFGRAYGFRVVGLQGISTVSEAALSDMASIVDVIRKEGVNAIFVESSVNPNAMKRIAQDSGVKIGGEIFSDAMGEPGEMRLGHDVGTYEGMIKYNVTTIVEALK